MVSLSLSPINKVIFCPYLWSENIIVQEIDETISVKKKVNYLKLMTQEVFFFYHFDWVNF
jgi:hypothetical protein